MNSQVKCDHCEKLIDENVFCLHEMRCAQISIKCIDCGRVYDRNYHEEHLAEFHRQERCKMCNQLQNDLKSHIPVCEFQTVDCEMCKIPILILELEEHLLQCQSKTSECAFCKKLIINSKLTQHELDCCYQQIQSQIAPKDKLIKSPIADQKEQQQKYEIPEQDFNYEDYAYETNEYEYS